MTFWAQNTYLQILIVTTRYEQWENTRRVNANIYKYVEQNNLKRFFFSKFY